MHLFLLLEVLIHGIGGTEEIMTVSQLKDLDPAIVELGLHSFEHRPYSSLSMELIQEDFKKCHDFVSKHALECV